jgi:hypothetical protein
VVRTGGGFRHILSRARARERSTLTVAKNFGILETTADPPLPTGPSLSDQGRTNALNAIAVSLTRRREVAAVMAAFVRRVFGNADRSATDPRSHKAITC